MVCASFIIIIICAGSWRIAPRAMLQYKHMRRNKDTRFSLNRKLFTLLQLGFEPKTMRNESN